MFKILTLAFLTLQFAGFAIAAESEKESELPAAVTPAVDTSEKAQALKQGGNPGEGKGAFEVCSACHLPSGLGRKDGSYPKLAGQHTSVLIKQIAEIRSEMRENPGMHSFAMELKGAEDIANVAAYIETLCIPSGNGTYGGLDADTRIAEGKTIYERDCSDCHKPKGEGVKEKFYPVLAGQHYRYLLRQMEDIRDGYRRNGDPDMVKTIKKYRNDKLMGVAAYLASLSTPGTPCEPGSGTRR
jgi:cytochrome c553